MTIVSFACQALALLALPSEINHSDVSGATAPVTINNGAVSVVDIKNNNAPITLAVRLTDRQLQRLTPQIVRGALEPTLKKMGEENRAKMTDSGWTVSDTGPLVEAVERVARATERSQDKVEQLQRRHEAEMKTMLDMLAELISNGNAEEAERRMEQDRWRTHPGWGVGVAGAAGAPTRTVSGGVGGSAEAIWTLAPVSFASTWNRAIRPFAGVTAGYAAMWREKQLFGYPNGPDSGIERVDLFDLGAVAGVLGQWEHWLAGVRTTGVTRPFSGLGLRWSVGVEGARRFGSTRWWLRAGASYAPYDSGAEVQDRLYNPTGAAPEVTSHVASPRFEGSLGLLALFP